MPDTFTRIPILPLSAALDPATKPQFLADLRSALLNVGFLYLSETGLPEQLVKDVVAECGAFFEKLPWEEKERIEMKNEKSFLGWSRVSVCDLLWFRFVLLLLPFFLSLSCLLHSFSFLVTKSLRTASRGKVRYIQAVEQMVFNHLVAGHAYVRLDVEKKCKSAAKMQLLLQ